MEERWKKIGESRKDCDPFYALLTDTDRCFKDKPEIKIIDELLVAGVSIIKKKYGKKLEENQHIATILDVTISDRYKGFDQIHKLFTLFVLLNHEPELVELLESFYDTNGGIFKEDGSRMFRKTMHQVAQNVDMLYRFPYDVANVVESINNFVLSVHNKYMCG